MICSAQSVWERSFHSINPIVTSIIVTDKHADRALSLFQIPWLKETTLHCLVFCLSRRRDVSRLIVSCINVTTTRITVSNEHQAVSENSVGCKTAMQFTWNINTYIHTRSFSPSLAYTEAHTRQKTLSIRRQLQGECAKPRKARETREREMEKQKRTKGMNMDVL